ncbi:hypothetical protein V5O48_005682 [Marasmius crinis-equi]|uniref:F-box domain-containing protein n=1 Tax=Marasmius crinis-equi TaxID=585013 RepID=A0ABR3FLK6_9AGAR
MLPIELWENIIEYCQHDTPSLSSCALVCKAWLPKSRQLLFSRHTVELYASNTQAFCDLPHTLKFYVAAIDLSGHSFTQPNGDQNGDGLIRLSQAVLDECTNLRSLTLYHAETVLSLFTRSPITSTLTTLHLRGHVKGPIRRLSVEAGIILDLVGNCTVLEDLSMYYRTPRRYISPGDTVEPVDSAAIERKKTTLRFLRKLDFHLVWSVFMPWFLIPGILRFPSVERLEISLGYLRQGDQTSLLPLLQPYLELFSPSLKELILRLDSGWDSIPGKVRLSLLSLGAHWYPPSALNVSRFKALRSFLFRVEGEILPVHFRTLCDIVRSTREGESESNPLTVILTVNNDNETVEPPDTEGVTWIFDEWYYEDHYK